MSANRPARSNPSSLPSQGGFDLEMEMRRRAQRMTVETNARNPFIPDNPFDFDFMTTGLPRDFEYHPVEVPNPNSPLYAAQVAVVNNYLKAGFEFLTTDLVSRDGAGGKARIPNFVEIDGRITIAGCYIMYADREHYQFNRVRNTERRNAIIDQQQAERETELGKSGLGNRQVQRVEFSTRKDVTLEQLMQEEGETTEAGEGGED